MTATLERPESARRQKRTRHRLVWAGVVLVGIIGIVAGTKIVPNDDPLLQGAAGFDAEEYAAENFDAVQENIEERAVDAGELAAAIAEDSESAAEQYAQEGSSGPIFPVTFTGVVGEGASGIYEVAVEGVPDDLLIRVQTGPAINGTELRDATGTMSFGDFSNQIQFQDVGAELNNVMKERVLANVDIESLEGATVTVTGAFTLINEASWLVTPVSLEIA